MTETTNGTKYKNIYLKKRTNNFIIAEISLNFQCDTKYIVYLLADKEEFLFNEENFKEGFLTLIRKKFKNKFNTVFTRDPTLLAPIFLQLSKNTNNIKVDMFTVRGKVYGITLTVNGDKIIKINNIEHFVREPVEIGEKRYLFQPFWSDGGGVSNEEQKLEKREITIRNLKKNCEYLRHLLTELDFNLSVINPNWFRRYSISSIAKNFFLTKLNPYAVNFRTSLREDEAIRKAYYGGRCEVLGNPYIGEQVFWYDFKNMYARIMLEEFPTGELVLRTDLKNITMPGFYYVSVRSETNWLPVLPQHSSFLTKGMYKELIFANGIFEGLYYSEELNYFVQNGGEILKIEYGYIFTGPTKPIFRDFSQTIINLRETLNKSIWKSVLVSLYGRLGMQPLNTETVVLTEADYINKKAAYNIESESWLMGHVFINHIINNKKMDSNVKYAAIITARARVKLHQNIDVIKKHGGRPLYCDTDSIFAAFTEDVTNRVMGDIVWAKSNITDAVFVGTRHYSIQMGGVYETKIAGIPRNSYPTSVIKEKLFSDYNDSLYFWKNHYSVFRHKEWKIEKAVNFNNYNKRVFSLDKKETKPWVSVNNILIEK